MTTMAWGEDITVLMELGFLVNIFTLDSAEDGVLDQDILGGTLVGDDVSNRTLTSLYILSGHKERVRIEEVLSLPEIQIAE